MYECDIWTFYYDQLFEIGIDMIVTGYNRGDVG